MSILLHTICVEPARWTTERVARPLGALLPSIARAGFRTLEVFEPHLALSKDRSGLLRQMGELGLTPSILSSYINLNERETPDAEFHEEVRKVQDLAGEFGFQRMRVFPGPRMNPASAGDIAAFLSRLEHLRDALPRVEILLESHDGSLADDPQVFASIFRRLQGPGAGLLYQPTRFPSEEAVAQFKLQKPFIRHVHLQNRKPDLSFATLAEGIVPWGRLLSELDPDVSVSLEFVPAGICPVQEFDLEKTLLQAVSETEYAAKFLRAG
jgi:sugar phosphate isomerase/epimerase